MKRFFKGNHSHGTVQTLLKDHMIDGIQAGQQFVHESSECLVGESYVRDTGSISIHQLL